MQTNEVQQRLSHLSPATAVSPWRLRQGTATAVSGTLHLPLALLIELHLFRGGRGQGATSPETLSTSQLLSWGHGQGAASAKPADWGKGADGPP